MHHHQRRMFLDAQSGYGNEETVQLVHRGLESRFISSLIANKCYVHGVTWTNRPTVNVCNHPRYEPQRSKTKVAGSKGSI